MIADKKAGSATIIEFDGFLLDRNLRRLERHGQVVKLTPKPFSTLEFLIENRPRVVSKEELLDKVWGGLRGIGTVEQAISHVRRALGDDVEEARYIATIPGQGYRWIAAVDPIRPAVENPAGKPEMAPRIRLAAVLAIIVFTAVAGLAIALLLRRSPPPVHIARAVFNGDTLIATSAADEILWKYVFDAQLTDPLPGEEAAWRTQIVDLNHDGKQEVLTAIGYASLNTAGHAQELLCFSGTGKLLWRYAPHIPVKFNTKKDLNGPWYLAQMLIAPSGEGSSIWVAINHLVWWPAFLMKLSPMGVPKLMFVSSGTIRALRRISNQSGDYILAGGVGNEYRAASLAVIREDGRPAVSPQSDGSEFKCLRGCPEGRPHRYILLPRSELNAASNLHYNWVLGLTPLADGVAVETYELKPEDLGGSTTAFYGFRSDFTPQSVAYGDNYAELHRRAEALGWIKHIFASCPERKSPAIIKIADENGKWNEVPVPRTP